MNDRLTETYGVEPTDKDGKVVDLRHRLRTIELRRLLELAVAGPEDSTAAEVAELYQRDPSRILFGLVESGRVLGILGGFCPHPSVLQIEVLAVSEAARRRGVGRRLVEYVAEHTGARSIWADTDGDAGGFYERCGFALRQTGTTSTGVSRFRAERRHPPEPAGFFTSPRIDIADDRHVVVELPAAGNTLPLVPPALRQTHVPAFVLAWVLEADEVGLMLQTLHPDLMPPVTPAVRPARVEEFLGSLDLGDGAPANDDAGNIAGLPIGLEIPAAVLATLAMSDRIAAWVRAGRRVRAWAEARGAGDQRWIMPDYLSSDSSKGVDEDGDTAE